MSVRENATGAMIRSESWEVLVSSDARIGADAELCHALDRAIHEIKKRESESLPVANMADRRGAYEIRIERHITS